MFDQADKRNLGRIAHPMKHRFAEERTADCNPVKSAGQFVFTLGFDGMGVANIIQLLVAFDVSGHRDNSTRAREGSGLPNLLTRC